MEPVARNNDRCGARSTPFLIVSERILHKSNDTSMEAKLRLDAIHLVAADVRRLHLNQQSLFNPSFAQRELEPRNLGCYRRYIPLSITRRISDSSCQVGSVASHNSNGNAAMRYECDDYLHRQRPITVRLN